ncbi:MAG: hypothetical protein ACI9MU_003510, partial [Alphaproteobacteria bacterium]
NDPKRSWRGCYQISNSWHWIGLYRFAFIVAFSRRADTVEKIIQSQYGVTIQTSSQEIVIAPESPLSPASA